MTVGKAVDAILVSFLFLAMAFGAAGQVRAQTSPEQAAQFVAALGHEAVGLQARRDRSGQRRNIDDIGKCISACD